MLNVKRFRCFLGWLGMLLPLIVLTLSIVSGHGLPDSISATYYLPACIAPFMIILGASGIFLLFYDGYDKQDDIVCTSAGIFALGICLFSCGTKDLIERWPKLAELTKVGTFQIIPAVSGVLHSICAIGFFALLAYNSIFLFTKTNGILTENKKKRNIIFRICRLPL